MKQSNILLASGSQALLRRRLVTSVVEAKKKEGWTINYADGAEKGSFSSAISGGVFFTGDLLVVVTSPEKEDPAIFQEHLESKSPVSVLLDHDGKVKSNTKFGKFAQTLGGWHQQFNPADKPWEEEEKATAFVVKEAKEQHGLEIDPQLAGGLVRRVGSDFGFLVFELRKMAALAELDGSSTIEVAHVRAAKADLLEASVGPLLDALQARDKRKVLVQLDRIYETSSSDPTMKITGLLCARVLLWLQAISLRNLPPREAAQEVGVNPWYFQNKIAPVASSWGEKRIIALIKTLARAERAVKNGAADPRVFLTASLMMVC